MKVYQNLTILLGDTPFHTFVTKMESRLRQPWSRNKKLESSMRSISAAVACFSLEGQTLPLRNGNVWLFGRGSEAQVGNIVPGPGGNLSEDEYNLILRRFVEDLAGPTAQDFGLQFQLSPAEPEIEDLVGGSAGYALRSFSSGANKETGSSNPHDLRHWHAFLIACVQEGRTLDTDYLFRWLVDDGWNSSIAHDLVIEYEQGIHLLLQYKETVG